LPLISDHLRGELPIRVNKAFISLHCPAPFLWRSEPAERPSRVDPILRMRRSGPLIMRVGRAYSRLWVNWSASVWMGRTHSLRDKISIFRRLLRELDMSVVFWRLDKLLEAISSLKSCLLLKAHSCAAFNRLVTSCVIPSASFFQVIF
jgi:hypothetical protein